MHKIDEEMKRKNIDLNSLACMDSAAIYLDKINSDIRTPFFRDIDKILYTLAFIRYADKTQVFTYQENDHLSKRIMHVLYVSKIARTIGRALNLNEDLIEAAALGHDLGHTPFGHVGEAILSEISYKHGEGYFNHNIHSVRLLKMVENHGKGLNITLQVLDAIMCHNGEFVMGEYHPRNKTINEFWSEYNTSYKDMSTIKKLVPMTLEGCVVRISDLIGYLGRDIEDGIRVGLIKESDIPKNIVNVLGIKNKEIINTIITDIIKNSYNKNYIKLSDDVYEAIVELKKFNYKNIYYHAYTEDEKKHIKEMFNVLFEQYIMDLKTNNTDSNIVSHYLSKMSTEYQKNTKERIVIDYIAGMTDDYFLKEYNKIVKNNQ